MSRHAAVHPGTGPLHHDLLWAWVSVLLVPVGLVTGMLLGDLLAGVPAVLVGALPGAVAVRYGLRARRDGLEAGLAPAVVGGAAAGFFVLVNLLAFAFGR